MRIEKGTKNQLASIGMSVLEGEGHLVWVTTVTLRQAISTMWESLKVLAPQVKALSARGYSLLGTGMEEW